ncbi:MAG: glycosyltransferase family 1 protein [Phycisphaerae bacterium]|nr:glycosyltransferase family 1 protein [Phycisphaerae bacterium]|tara:strand:- start:1307 stop:2404 length:1098 start_codon:yes stop_codon:yes gene_type:complete
MSRVLLLGSYAPSLVLFRAPLLKALVQAGHEVVASAPDEDSSIAGAMEQLGVRWAPIDFERNKVQPVQDLVLVRRLRAHLRDIQPDRLITYTIKPNIYGGWAACSEDIPSAAMITGLGTMFMNPGIRRGIAQRMLRKAVRHHDRVFFQNGDDRDDLVNAGVVEDASKIVMTAGSGVDLEKYPVQSLPDRPVFLMLARLLVAKGVREYLEAAAILKEKHPDAVVRLGGMEDPGSGGVPMSEIQQAVEDGVIEYLGHVDDVQAALSQCSIYVLPSWHEGTPRSVLEAMSTGRAVITTDARGCRETVEDGRNGLLVPLRDPHALSNAMHRLASDSALRIKMGIESRNIAQDCFDANQVADVMLRSLNL